MYDTRVNQNTANRVSSWTPPVRSGINPVGFFIGDSQMKRIDISTPKYPNTFTLVDDEDFEWLNQQKWCAKEGRNTTYVTRTVYLGGGSKNRKYKGLSMHRVVMNAKKGQEIDHRSRCGLDNTKNNLRVCTRIQNSRNSRPHKISSSRFKGVSWSIYHRKWLSRLYINKKQLHLGYRDSEIECAKLYDKKAKELFGEFANTNFKGVENGVI